MEPRALRTLPVLLTTTTFVGEPLLSTSNIRFAKLFNLLMRPVRHEIGNKLSEFTEFVLGNCEDKIDRLNVLFKVFKRLRVFSFLITSGKENPAGKDLIECFSQAEIKFLKVDRGISYASISLIKDLVIAEIREFKKILLEFEQIIIKEEKPENLDLANNLLNIIKLGEILCDFLDKIAFEEDLSEYKMSLVNGSSSLFDQILAVANQFYCKINYVFEANHFNDIKVTIHPVFSLLIFIGIFSNAQRAMQEKRNNEPILLELEVKLDT